MNLLRFAPIQKERSVTWWGYGAFVSSRTRHIPMLSSIALKAIEDIIIEWQLRSISVRSNAIHYFIGKRRGKKKKKALSNAPHAWHSGARGRLRGSHSGGIGAPSFVAASHKKNSFSFFCDWLLATVWLATKWLATKIKHLSHKKVPRPFFILAYV